MATRRQLLGMIAGTGAVGVGTAGFVVASDHENGDGIGNGCTPGFWAQAVGEDTWEGYNHDDTLGGVFSGATWVSELEDMTFIEALGGGGGPGIAGAQRILARAAVASLLNAAHDTVGWWPNPLVSALDEGDVISMVEEVLVDPIDDQDRDEILALAEDFDEWNNQDCPISADPGGAGRGNVGAQGQGGRPN